MSKYPECEKLKAVSEKSNLIGSFLDWLETEKEISLHVRRSEEELEEASKEMGVVKDLLYYRPYFGSKEKLLAEYFDIDLDKVEQERQQILKDLQTKNNSKNVTT